MPGPRVSILPRGIAAEHAARRLGLTNAEFKNHLPELYSRGFPRPDLTTQRFDRKAIEHWMDSQSGLAVAPAARDGSVLAARIEVMRHGAG